MSCWYYYNGRCRNPHLLSFGDEMDLYDGCEYWVDVPEEELQGK